MRVPLQALDLLFPRCTTPERLQPRLQSIRGAVEANPLAPPCLTGWQLLMGALTRLCVLAITLACWKPCVAHAAAVLEQLTPSPWPQTIACAGCFASERIAEPRLVRHDLWRHRVSGTSIPARGAEEGELGAPSKPETERPLRGASRSLHPASLLLPPRRGPIERR